MFVSYTICAEHWLEDEKPLQNVIPCLQLSIFCIVVMYECDGFAFDGFAFYFI